MTRTASAGDQQGFSGGYSRRVHVYSPRRGDARLRLAAARWEASARQGVVRLCVSWNANSFAMRLKPTKTDQSSDLHSNRTPTEPSPWLARSLARTGARRRLEAELRAIAVDLLGRCQPGELPDDCAEWLATTVEGAVTRVCDSSLAALAEMLESRLGAAPPRVVRHLDEAEVRHDAGYV
jgi:hypothetical protein